MTIASSLRFRLTAMALSLAALGVGGGSDACGDEPIVLRQPATTSKAPSGLRQPRTTLVVMTAASEEPVAEAAPTPVAAAAAPKAAMGRPAPFTPHYLCLCAPYCPKPMPCPNPCYECVCDDYCPKPMPCPNPCYECVCDDYCPKPYPCPLPQPLCGPRAPARQTEPCPIYAPYPPRGPCVVH
ncbi:hypothetical protein [Lacipirellula limnantheis]|uniref:Uncharacterized protein n=1 Tax=Lacipirellula limnantheis TaxID=2528024 RepID=A0A517U5A9_9BACT|nr:hypothetical protein [Lacipirellula limnantheis]QDT75812.1 hypothetical protein I41_50550 [Lacipirellula limnantheis]